MAKKMLRIGERSAIWGVPKWIGKLFKCDSDVIQEATITFKNTEFAEIKARVCAEVDDEVRAHLKGCRFFLVELPSDNNSVEATELLDSRGDVRAVQREDTA